MLGAVVEHFIDHVSEREFDAPFIALLLKLGFGDVHYLHGQYEFGKDFIARAIEGGQQVQYVFQSKAGDLNLGDWSKGTPQLDLLRTNTLAHPGFDAALQRRAVLVLTGRLTGGAGLFPHARTIKSQGVGTDVLSFLLPNDETVKAIPADNLSSSREAHLNATFRNLISYRLLRAASWSEYAEAAFRFRRNACDAFRGLHRGWARFLEHRKIQASDFAKMPGLELSRLQASRIHMFPRTAVDEWGFVSEDNSKQRSPVEAAPQRQLLGNLQRFAEWRTLWKDYEWPSGKSLIERSKRASCT